MPDQKVPPATKASAPDSAKVTALFDAFAEQAAKTAVWSDAVKQQLPAKTDAVR